ADPRPDLVERLFDRTRRAAPTAAGGSLPRPRRPLGRLRGAGSGRTLQGAGPGRTLQSAGRGRTLRGGSAGLPAVAGPLRRLLSRLVVARLPLAECGKYEE